MDTSFDFVFGLSKELPRPNYKYKFQLFSHASIQRKHRNRNDNKKKVSWEHLSNTLVLFKKDDFQEKPPTFVSQCAEQILS